MSEARNQNPEHNQENQEISGANNFLDFEKESEAEIKALAKGLMVDLVWTLSGMNQASKKEDKPKDSSQPN